ncbi:MAG: hypothetical protein ACLP1Y_12820 [Candidatus Acidiferrales bacterium]
MNPYWFVIATTIIAQLGFFLRWLHRRTRDDEIHRAFVRDMAVNHLPHIYHALRQVATRLSVELTEPPPIRFVDLNAKDGHDC